MKLRLGNRTWSNIKGTLPVLLAALLSLTGFFPKTPVQAESGSACPAGKSCAFLPAAVAETPNDLILQSIEVTQAVQDANNSVPLVAGRPAVMRIYAVATGVTEPVADVQISISAVFAGKQASGSPDTFTAVVPLTDNRADYASTINFPLPESWLTGAYDLTVRLDANSMIREKSEENNSLSIHLSFNQVPALNVMVVPVLYTHADGHTYPAPSVDAISEWLMRIYPVNKVALTWHAPYAFSGDLRTTSDFNRLLNEITTLKSTENAPADQIYYGLVPTQDGATSWFYGGVAGIGWIGSRASVGVDAPGNTAQIAGHEIGHNLGMLHTPCGVTGDPNYPYAGGSIGQFGLDILTNSVYNPSNSKDMMSYCNPRWISDYTYKFLFNSQMATVAASASRSTESVESTREMLVRATITGGKVDLQPVYILKGQAEAAPDKGDYTVQVLGSQGEVIAQAAVTAYGIENENASEEQPVYGINTVIPIPDRPVAAVRLLKNGQVAAEQKIQSAAAGLTADVVTVPSAGGFNLRWGWSDRPALVRYSPDGGRTWITLAADAEHGQMPVAASSLFSAGSIFDVIPANTWK